MCATFLSACVVPPTLEEAPPSQNSPPAILRDQVLPDPGLLTHTAGADEDLTLDLIPVTDPNVEDKLTLRLLLDGIQVRTLPPLLTGGELREFRNVDVGQPCDFIDAGLVGLLVGVVSDRDFAGAGREVPAEAGTSSVEWVIACLDPPL